jgi:uncharacterized protein YbjT (DUF2867 family)
MMKIIVTGSLGQISKPLTEELVQKGHSVTVISRKPEKQKEIEALGAKAAIGTMEDADFLTATFTDADAIYCMISSGAVNTIVNNYKHAIQGANVKRVIFLSSVGAHTDKNNGFLRDFFVAENILNELPADVAITHLRAAGFYSNLFRFINAIKTHGVITSNYGADDETPWVAPMDIAAVAAEEILRPSDGRRVRYVASDEATCNEVAAALGAAIGKPDLKWLRISDEQRRKELIASGMPPYVADGFVEMHAGTHSGAVCADYFRNRPTLGKVKLADFAKEFAVRFHQ